MVIEYWVWTLSPYSIENTPDESWSVTSKVFGKRELESCLRLLRDGGYSYKVRKYGSDEIIAKWSKPF